MLKVPFLRLLFAIFLIPMQFVVAQTPVTLVSDGAWTWFNDPRAVFKNGKLYFGYMRAGDGKAALGVYDPQTAAAPTVLWSSTWVEKDDHNNPGLLPLQDGRLMAFYARHATGVMSFNHRLSTSASPTAPGDWGAEQTYSSTERISYANPFQLSAESGRIYNFMRNLNYNPTFITTDDFGASWSTAKILIKTGTGGAIRPYVKYASNAADRIDFLYTDGHPRDVTNSLYHAYYKNGSLYKTDGTFLKTLANAPLLHDSGERGSVFYQYSGAATTNPNDHIPTGRAWCWDLVYDSAGNPAATFSVQRDNVTGPSWSDDRIYYYYARWVPGTGWQKQFVAHAGRPLYESEDDYAGGICIDPKDSNVIYISTNAANPFNLGDTTNVPLSTSQRYEIYRGVTADGGLTFTWQAITKKSAVDNLRPYVPRGPRDFAHALIWFAGTYTSYTSWNASVRGYFSDTLPNQAPAVTITSPAGAAAVLSSSTGKIRLTAAISDDGQPAPVSAQWSVASGPAGATFADAASADTIVTLPQAGRYVLRLTASDSVLTAAADVTVETGVPAAPPGATLWLKLDEAGGATATDSSGAGNHGTVAGGTAWQPAGGRIAGALEFGGASGFAGVPDAPSLEPGAAFTLTFWLRATAYNSNGSGLVSKRDGFDTNNAFTTYLNGNPSDAPGYQRITVDIVGVGDRFTSNARIDLGAWRHVALVFDGSKPPSGRASLYIDGALDKTATESSAAVPDYTSSLRAGLTHAGASTWLAGRLDDIRFFQRALPPGEISVLAGSVNFAPSVTAGPAPAAVRGESASLQGAVSDDGKGGPLSSAWSQVSGPGAVAFGDPASAATSAVFSEPGSYLLRLSASDSTAETSAHLAVSVSPNPNVYADWIAAAFPGETDPGVIGALADSEGDSIQNLMEFALGLDPSVSDAAPFSEGRAGLPVAAIRDVAEGQYLTLEVRRPAGRAGVGYSAAVSGDLTQWMNGVQAGPAVANGDGSEIVLFRDVVPVDDETSRFIRLKVRSAE